MTLMGLSGRPSTPRIGAIIQSASQWNTDDSITFPTPPLRSHQLLALVTYNSNSGTPGAVQSGWLWQHLAGTSGASGSVQIMLGRPDPDSNSSGALVQFTGLGSYPNHVIAEMASRLEGIVEQASVYAAGGTEFLTPLIVPKRSGLWCFAAARCSIGGAAISSGAVSPMTEIEVPVLAGIQHGPATNFVRGRWTRDDFRNWSGLTIFVR